jgi:hypothetical protein
VDIEADTVAALRAYRPARGSISLELVRDPAPVLGTLEGKHRHPERYSRRCVEQVVQARKALGEDQLPRIRLDDLRHTHATLLLAAGEPVKVVSERLGHASATITLTVSSTSAPAWAGRPPTGSPRCSGADQRREVSRRYHAPFLTLETRTPRGPELQEHRGDRCVRGRHATYAHGSRPPVDRSVCQAADQPIDVSSWEMSVRGPR